MTYRGKDGFIEFMRLWTEDFDDWAVELEQTVHATNDHVVVVLRQRGTGKQSGVPIELTHGSVFEFENGRVKRLRVFADPAEAFEAAAGSD